MRALQLAVGLMSAIAAAQVSLVADLNTQNEAVSSQPSSMTAVGARVIFNACDGRGCELWGTDGTADGSGLIADIFPGLNGSHPSQLTVSGAFVYFTASDGTRGRELWRTDGTPAGTSIVIDLIPGPQGSDPSHLVPLGASGGVCFVAFDPAFGRELWCSNGTAAGTAMVRDLSPGMQHTSFSNMDPVGNKIVFTVNVNPWGSEPWVSDGTVGGTVLLKDIIPGIGSSSPFAFATSQGQLYFLASTPSSGGQVTLWRTNGTPVGTQTVPAVDAGTWFSTPGDLLLGTASALFSVRRNIGIFQSVGATALTSLNATPCFNGLGEVTTERLFFMGPTTFSCQLFTAAGDGGFAAVNDIATGSGKLSSMGTPALLNGGTLLQVAPLFSSSSHLWMIRGAEATSLRSWASLGSTPVALGNIAVFSAFEPTSGRELWRSDGTGAGTALLKDLYQRSASSFPSNLALAGNRVFFTAQTVDAGRELMRTDGTDGGTGLVRELVPGARDPGIAWPIGLGTRLLFSADAEGFGREPWVSDGTAAGTRLLMDISPSTSGSDPGPFVRVGGVAYFAASTPGEGRELWVTDGTAAGTKRVADLVPGPASSAPTDLLAVGNRLFFAAQTPATGAELFVADSTGARLAVELASGAKSSYPDELVTDGVVIAFVGNDTQGVRKAWLGDGTQAGTRAVTLPFAPPGSTPNGLAAVAGSKLFFFSPTPDGGVGVWKEDGTPGSPYLMRALAPTSLVGNQLVPVGGRVVFTSSEGDGGVEPWVSDGTVSGTRVLRDLQVGPLGSNPRDFVAVGGRLYFAADDGVAGDELWVTDGTAANTALAADVVPGAMGSSPSAPLHAGSRLYFAATSLNQDRELWQLLLDPSFDNTAPLIRPILEGTSSDAGWFVSDVKVSWDVRDEDSQIDAGCPPAMVTADTVLATFSCQASSIGGTSSASVSVRRDAKPPEVTCPGDVQIESASALAVTFAVSATDALDPNPSLTVSPSSGQTFKRGTTRVTATAIDAAGNQASCAFDVKVTAPAETDGGEPLIPNPVTPKTCGCSAIDARTLGLLVGLWALARRQRRSARPW